MTFFYSSSEEEGNSGDWSREAGDVAQFRVEVGEKGKVTYKYENIPEYEKLMKAGLSNAINNGVIDTTSLP